MLTLRKCAGCTRSSLITPDGVQHSCHSPPIGGDGAKILQANRPVLKKMEGILGGMIPPNWRGNPAMKFSFVPPNTKNLQVWRFGGGNIGNPTKYMAFGGENRQISPANLVGSVLFSYFPATLQGCPLHISESGGDIDLQANLWGTLGGDTFCVRGDIFGVRPPQLGGIVTTMY